MDGTDQVKDENTHHVIPRRVIHLEALVRPGQRVVVLQVLEVIEVSRVVTGDRGVERPVSRNAYCKQEGDERYNG